MTLRPHLTPSQHRAHEILDMVKQGLHVEQTRITWALIVLGDAEWSPLTDDGDALRLAVKLRLRVCTPTTDTDCALASNGDITCYSEDELESITIIDLYAATRRAIVRAAAAIGEAMQ